MAVHRLAWRPTRSGSTDRHPSWHCRVFSLATQQALNQDENGKPVGLKPKAEVEVTIEAEKRATEPRNSPDSKRPADPRSDNSAKISHCDLVAKCRPAFHSGGQEDWRSSLRREIKSRRSVSKGGRSSRAGRRLLSRRVKSCRPSVGLQGAQAKEIFSVYPRVGIRSARNLRVRLSHALHVFLPRTSGGYAKAPPHLKIQRAKAIADDAGRKHQSMKVLVSVVLGLAALVCVAIGFRHFIMWVSGG
jgi:hypothetical protein